MTLEALSSNEFLNFVIYDTISATPFMSQEKLGTASFSVGNNENNSSVRPQLEVGALNFSSSQSILTQQLRGGVLEEAGNRKQNLKVQARGKRRRKPRVCKNKAEAETQRMTHIAVERNRRKLMNEQLAVLRSLTPESYVQRGDQASIVGGAIEFLKALEQLLQSLKTKKFQLLQNNGVRSATGEDNSSEILPQRFSQFFVYPQYNWSQSQFPSSKLTTKTKDAIADIEVTLIETHANLRILSRRSPRQLSKLVAGFQSLHLSILHLNVSTMGQLVLYSISAKVEEGCQLITVDDIAGAVHHMLRIIEEATNGDGITVLNCP